MKILFQLAFLAVIALSCQTTKRDAQSHSHSGIPESIKTFYVAPVTLECTGVGKKQCLLVKRKITDNWQFFHQNIKGFTHEWGYTSILKVRETPVDNAPADASSLSYELVEIVEQERVSQEFSHLHDIYGIRKLNGTALESSIQTLEIYPAEKNILGTGGCNTFKGKVDTTAQWNGLLFKDILSTRKTCPDQKTEDAYLKALNQVTSYYRYNNLLLFFHDRDLLIEAVKMD